jgi:hypothetical protein
VKSHTVEGISINSIEIEAVVPTQNQDMMVDEQYENLLQDIDTLIEEVIRRK